MPLMTVYYDPHQITDLPTMLAVLKLQLVDTLVNSLEEPDVLSRNDIEMLFQPYGKDDMFNNRAITITVTATESPNRQERLESATRALIAVLRKFLESLGKGIKGSVWIKLVPAFYLEFET